VAERITFYMDEHAPRVVTEGLRRRGVDGASDSEHLEVAAKKGCVVFTQDADFLRLHASGASHSGTVYVPQQTPVGAIVRSLMVIYELLSSEEMIGRVEFL
jgi:predicted nuclease of predicted toxin-antitoxin system